MWTLRYAGGIYELILNNATDALFGATHEKFYCHLLKTIRRRTLKSTLHPTIFWEMVKFVDLDVLYFSLVLPQ